MSTKQICGIIPPRPKDIDLVFDEFPSRAFCILPEGHYGSHVLRDSRGRVIEWENDRECDCCEVDETDRCIFFGEISSSELTKKLQE